jgi:hypothetical protein
VLESTPIGLYSESIEIARSVRSYGLLSFFRFLLNRATTDTLGSVCFILGKGFMKGALVFGKQKKAVGPVVQLGKTSPSRGEDRRFKSGSAHFLLCFCCTGV